MVAEKEAEVTVERLSGEGEVVRPHQTDSGIPLAAEYGPAGEASDEAGTFPYRRGIRSGMYRQELWHRDLYSGFGSLSEAKERYEDLLRDGASGVNMALDLPTQLGHDSDAPEARGEVGKVGTALDSLSDVVDLFENIPLDQAEIIFTVGNGIGPIALSWFKLLADRQGVAPADYVVHLQNDPLKEFTGRGTFIYPLEPHVRMACDVVEYCARSGYMHWKPIGICGSQYRWGGGGAVEEIGFALAAARTYIEELLNRGLSIDEFAPLLELHLTVDTDVFEEAAKFRAARVLWAEMMRNDYGAKLPESEHLRVSLYTAGYRLTAQQPLNNSVRITLQALGAVLGGVQHLGTLSIDEALSTPSAEAARLAVQTQNILAYETSIASVADPLGGSYLVESLTDELIERMRKAEQDVAQRGGTIKALKEGYLQEVIQSSAYQYQRDIDSGKRTVVGVNQFRSENAAPSDIQPFRISDEPRQLQIKRLAELRERRDTSRVQEALRDVEEAARGPENLVPPIMAACDADATIGEICGVMREVFGTWDDGDVLF